MKLLNRVRGHAGAILTLVKLLSFPVCIDSPCLRGGEFTVTDEVALFLTVI